MILVELDPTLASEIKSCSKHAQSYVNQGVWDRREIQSYVNQGVWDRREIQSYVNQGVWDNLLI